ncbi:MAG: hypothetical protein PUC23_02785 [bacterium]|nr:hypothetical protein [bacterium]
MVEFVSPDNPWFERSANFDTGSLAGVFSFSSLDGDYYMNGGGFRSALVK